MLGTAAIWVGRPTLAGRAPHCLQHRAAPSLRQGLCGHWCRVLLVPVSPHHLTCSFPGAVALQGGEARTLPIPRPRMSIHPPGVSGEPGGVGEPEQRRWAPCCVYDLWMGLVVCPCRAG